MDIGNIWDTLSEFIGHWTGEVKHKVYPEESKSLPDPEREFLYGFQWLEADSTHHAKAMYYAEKREMYFVFHDGRVVTVENVALWEAKNYYHANSKGTWYWNHVRVRGKGNARKTRKPFHYGGPGG